MNSRYSCVLLSQLRAIVLYFFYVLPLLFIPIVVIFFWLGSVFIHQAIVLLCCDLFYFLIIRVCLCALSFKWIHAIMFFLVEIVVRFYSHLDNNTVWTAVHRFFEKFYLLYLFVWLIHCCQYTRIQIRCLAS